MKAGSSIFADSELIIKIARIRSLCAGCTAVLFLISAICVVGAPGDEHWDTQFGWPGTLNSIASIATHNNKLYLGGFSSPSNATVTVWDGTRWSSMGEFTGSQVQIWDLAFVGDVLYAAGTFTNIDGAEIRGLARW